MVIDKLEGKVTDGTIWYAKDLQDDSSWVNPITEAQQQELLDALAVAKENKCTVNTIKKADFPLATLG